MTTTTTLTGTFEGIPVTVHDAELISAPKWETFRFGVRDVFDPDWSETDPAGHVHTVVVNDHGLRRVPTVTTYHAGRVAPYDDEDFDCDGCTVEYACNECGATVTPRMVLASGGTKTFSRGTDYEFTCTLEFTTIGPASPEGGLVIDGLPEHGYWSGPLRGNITVDVHRINTWKFKATWHADD